jgi:Family of unknown function (DUF6361)
VPSMMAWLDQSAEQQRRARELVRLFSDTESRDELGIGQIRDVYSNRLFPGTSVIQTRARYFLFVPWLFRMHERRRRAGSDLLRRVQASERQLIETLKASGSAGGGDLDGLIGARAGARVKILPSTVYWGGLSRFGILVSPVAPDELRPLVPLDALDPEAADEPTGRLPSNWHPTLPDPPTGFPESIPGGFRLRSTEAAWLRDVILEAAPRTLLSHLVAQSHPPPSDLEGPWGDPAALSSEEETVSLIDEAHMFSLSVHGAALLYNLLLAKAYEGAGLDRVTGAVDRYEQAIRAWVQEVTHEHPRLRTWNLDRWWFELHSYNPRISPRTQLFVNGWLELARSDRIRRILDDRVAHELIAHRERAQKKAQARLGNERLLRNWNGASGAELLTYRWPTVRRIVADIVEPLEAADAAA